MPRTMTLPWTHEWIDHRWDVPAWLRDWHLWSVLVSDVGHGADEDAGLGTGSQRPTEK